jgi:hypothetical protein
MREEESRSEKVLFSFFLNCFSRSFIVFQLHKGGCLFASRFFSRTRAIPSCVLFCPLVNVAAEEGLIGAREKWRLTLENERGASLAEADCFALSSLATDASFAPLSTFRASDAFRALTPASEDYPRRHNTSG